MFVSDDDCELQFLWQNSSFCVGEEECSVTDPDTNYVYDLDGLFSQTWSVSQGMESRCYRKIIDVLDLHL